MNKGEVGLFGQKAHCLHQSGLFRRRLGDSFSHVAADEPPEGARFSEGFLPKAGRRKKAEQKQTAPASGGFQIVSESGETDAQVEALLQARYDAKKAKDFTEADRIRDDLKAMGVEITDIPGGVRWKR